MSKAGRHKERRIEKNSAPETVASTRQDFLTRPIAPLILISLLALLVNLNVLQNGFGWDDETIIQSFRPAEHGWPFLLPDPADGPPSKENASYFRPVVAISYHVDTFLWGHDPFGFHLSVLIAHWMNTVLVFFLARALISETSFHLLPVLAASLFAVHPAHAEAVAWIAGRNDVFCTTFLLASFWLYLQFHRTGKGILFWISMIAFALALLTKEVAVGLIVLFPLYDILSGNKRVSIGESRQIIFRRIGIRFLIPLTILGLYFWKRTALIAHPYGQASPTDMFSWSTIPQILGAIGFYLKMMIFPYPHRPFISDIPASASSLILTGSALALLSSALIAALIRRKILFGIGLGWTLVFLAPAVSVAVVNVAATPAAERYLYAPSAGFLIAAAGLLLNGLKRLPSSLGRSPSQVRIAAGLLIFSVITLWGWESAKRNTVWRDPVSFWQAAIAASPDAGFPYRELGKHYVQLRQLDEAEPLYPRAIAVDEKRFGPDHPNVAAGLNLLGVLYQNQGRYAEAEPLYQRALTIREKTLGANHSDTAASLNNLALLYYNQRRYAEAETLYKRVIEIDEKIFGPDHPDLAASLNNVAGLYDAQGRYAEAESLYHRALAIREKSFGPDHSDVAQTLNNLSVIYHRLGRYAEAEPLYRRSLSIREKNLGPDHPDLAVGFNNLAGLYYAQGKYAEAEPLFRRALAIREKSLRPDHPDLATSLENYALLLRKMKRDAEAAPMETRARIIRSKRAP